MVPGPLVYLGRAAPPGHPCAVSVRQSGPGLGHSREQSGLLERVGAGHGAF